MTTDRLYKELFARYGGYAQLIKACEEIGELQVALCKYLNDQGTKDAIYEEVADVRIMLEQIEFYFESWEKVAQIRLDKLTRTKERLMKG